MSSPSPSSLIPVLPYQCMNNFNQEVARTIVRKVSATLSIISSFYVLRLIYIKYRSTTATSTASNNNNNNNNRNNTVDSYHRIMAGLCIYDVLFSFFWWFMGSWMTPRDTGWWGARYGNTASCMIQGAVTDFALIGIWVRRLVFSCIVCVCVCVCVRVVSYPCSFARDPSFIQQSHRHCVFHITHAPNEHATYIHTHT